MDILLIASVVASMFSGMLCAEFPSPQLCNPDDGKCIGKASSDFIKLNVKGRQDMGIPILDPFQIDTLTIRRTDGDGGPFSLDLNLHNVNIRGLSSLSFDKVIGFTKDPHTSKMELYGIVPKLNIKGKYKVNGRIFILPIEGSGDVTIAVDNMKISFKLKPKIFRKNGVNHLQVDKLKVKLEPKNLEIKLTNLFNGDEKLGDSMNGFLNSNWREVWEEVSPAVNNAMEDVLIGVIDNVFKGYAYEDIFSSS